MWNPLSITYLSQIPTFSGIAQTSWMSPSRIYSASLRQMHRECAVLGGAAWLRGVLTSYMPASTCTSSWLCTCGQSERAAQPWLRPIVSSPATVRLHLRPGNLICLTSPSWSSLGAAVPGNGCAAEFDGRHLVWHYNVLAWGAPHPKRGS